MDKGSVKGRSRVGVGGGWQVGVGLAIRLV